MNSNGVVMIGIIVIVALVVVFFEFICLWKIVSKAGYHGALSLLMLVPIVNIIMFIIFAFVEWPVQKELKLLKSQVGRPPIQP